MILGSSSSKTVTLTNGGTTAVTINSIGLTQTTDYTLGTASTSPCPTSGTLNGKASCNILLTFSPKSIGSKKGTLVIKSNDPASPLLLSMSGTGASYETFTPNPVNFTATLLIAGTLSIVDHDPCQPTSGEAVRD